MSVGIPRRGEGDVGVVLTLVCRFATLQWENKYIDEVHNFHRFMDSIQTAKIKLTLTFSESGLLHW